MIQMQTNLDVADNSGARRVMCIKVLGGSKRNMPRRRHHRRLGQGSDPARPREEGRRDEGGGGAHRQGHQAPRRHGHPLRQQRGGADQQQKEPIGTRIFGPVPRELRAKNHMKIISLAPEVL